jgi:hypothetical protein
VHFAAIFANCFSVVLFATRWHWLAVAAALQLCSSSSSGSWTSSSRIPPPPGPGTSIPLHPSSLNNPVNRNHVRALREEALLLRLFYALPQSSNQLQALETMSRSSSTFKKNDRVEALWLEDGKWYPAEVLQVKANNVYRIRFDGYVEEYDRPNDDLRVPNVLAIPDCLNGGTVSFALVPDGILQSPKKLYAHIMHPLKLIKRHKWFFAHHRRQKALPPLGCVVAECSPCGRVRLMLRCVAFACQRLVTAPADMHMFNRRWSWAEVVMDRLTRGRVRKVHLLLQVWLQRRACCAVRCACRSSACVRCDSVFDACCSKRWLVFRSDAEHRSGCIKVAAAFILMYRLLLPPALQADPTLCTRQQTETAFRCFAM